VEYLEYLEVECVNRFHTLASIYIVSDTKTKQKNKGIGYLAPKYPNKKPLIYHSYTSFLYGWKNQSTSYIYIYIYTVLVVCILVII